MILVFVETDSDGAACGCTVSILTFFAFIRPEIVG